MTNTTASVQKYTFEIIHHQDGNYVTNIINEGFSAIEIIGISQIIKESVMSQFHGAIKDYQEVGELSPQ